MITLKPDKNSMRIISGKDALLIDILIELAKDKNNNELNSMINQLKESSYLR